MLNFTNLTLRRGPRVLFTGASFTIHAGNRVGVTGANGTGKSSLFALLREELHADAGEVSMPPNLTIAHVAQETPALDRAAIDYVLDGDAALRAIQTEIRAIEAAGDGHRLAKLHADLDHAGGYTAMSRAGTLLHGLGFKPGEERRSVKEFSGGWRMRLNLAQALMCRSDLLLLDEPTNHLDLEATLWLGEWLRRYPGTLLLISHDREFLDDIVDHVLHLERQTVALYAGNYAAFEQRRAEQMAQQTAAYVRQQREVARIHSFVDRFRAKATKARQAQSRLKALARMELLAPAHADSPFGFGFFPPRKLPTPLLQLEEVGVGYGDDVAVQDIRLSLAPGDRIGLLGPNGAGKSTLIKTLAGELQPLSGARLPAQDLHVGYFAQHQLEQLNPALTPLAHLQRLDPKATEQDLRNFLGGFGFHGDQALGDVSVFSGGERARLVLALLVHRRPNLLLLDEPTNHLDLEMRHALSVALQEFEGAMVIISHDRYMLRTVADRFLVIADRRVQSYSGDLDDYSRWITERNRERERRELAVAAGSGAATERATGGESAAERKERRRLEAEQRQRRAPLRAQLQSQEAAIERLGQRRAEIQTALSQPDMYADGQKERLKSLLAEQADVAAQLAEAEDRWLSLSTELEAHPTHGG